MFAQKAIPRTVEQQHWLDTVAKDLALYQYTICPFCIRVRHELSRLGLPVELRDILRSDEHRKALLAGGGRTTVPCLLVNHKNGEEVWMYESGDIVQWLRQNFETVPEYNDHDRI